MSYNIISSNHEQIPSIFQHPRYVEGSQENTETLQRFTETLYELQAVNPEIAGATLRGSRLKGTSTPESDVDCTIFLDADALAARGCQIKLKPNGYLDWGYNKQLRVELQSHIVTELARKTGKPWDIIDQGVSTMAISERFIHELLGKYFTWQDADAKYTNALNTHWETGNGEIPEPPDQVSLDIISPLFAAELSATPMLNRCRGAVIDELSQAGPPGEEAWKELLAKVAWYEGHRDIKDSTAYPTDLALARQWYEVANKM